ncbi:hypothetical protein SeLEV6574_g04948 [Synchytrium endobioticum]|nr:hypothetical protein SeLEV6574_g04948 [Synchytrium endobioticum]
MARTGTSTSNSSGNDSPLHTYLQSVGEWSDDVRARALYAAFQDKTVNKTAYEARLAIWKRILSTAAASGLLSSSETDGRLCLYRKDLEVKFKRKGVVPLGLQTVIDEMVAAGATSSSFRVL